jgi:hypothetical protein
VWAAAALMPTARARAAKRASLRMGFS